MVIGLKRINDKNNQQGWTHSIYWGRSITIKLVNRVNGKENNKKTIIKLKSIIRIRRGLTRRKWKWVNCCFKENCE